MAVDKGHLRLFSGHAVGGFHPVDQTALNITSTTPGYSDHNSDHLARLSQAASLGSYGRIQCNCMLVI